WWREEATRQRDAALRELAARYCADQPIAAQARRLCALSLRYAASAWRFDEGREALPCHYAGTVREGLWKGFAPRPPSPRGRAAAAQCPPAGAHDDDRRSAEQFGGRCALDHSLPHRPSARAPATARLRRPSLRRRRRPG